MDNDTKLMKIVYFRGGNFSNKKNAVVTEQQLHDIKTLLPHIHIINVYPAPLGSQKDYILK